MEDGQCRMFYIHRCRSLRPTSESESHSVMCESLQLHGLCTVHGILQARILEWVAIPFFRGNLSNPGVEPRSPTLQADSLPAEPQGKTLQVKYLISTHILLYRIRHMANLIAQTAGKYRKGKQWMITIISSTLLKNYALLPIYQYIS